MKLVIGALAVLLAVVGCSNPPETGRIVRKTYSAPFEYPQSQCVSYDKNGLCRASITVFRHEPAHYGLCLRDESDPAHPREGCREVDAATYHHYAVGQHYGGNGDGDDRDGNTR